MHEMGVLCDFHGTLVDANKAWIKAFETYDIPDINQVITDVYLAYVPLAPVGEKDPVFAAHPYWVLQTETEVTSNKNGETVTSKREQIYLVDTINKSIFIGR